MKRVLKKFHDDEYERCDVILEMLVGLNSKVIVFE